LASCNDWLRQCSVTLLEARGLDKGRKPGFPTGEPSVAVGGDSGSGVRTFAEADTGTTRMAGAKMLARLCGTIGLRVSAIVLLLTLTEVISAGAVQDLDQGKVHHVINIIEARQHMSTLLRCRSRLAIPIICEYLRQMFYRFM
jgi:hypothetical protein